MHAIDYEDDYEIDPIYDAIQAFGNYAPASEEDMPLDISGSTLED